MDLDTLTTEETATIEVKHPVTGKPVEDDKGVVMTVEIYGSDTKHYRKLVAEIARAGSEADDGAARIVAGCIKSWSIVVAGKVPPVSDAMAVFEKLPWLRDQIDRAIHSRGNFIRAA